MDNTIKSLRRFIIKEIVSSKSKWSSEGREDYFSTNHLIIKKNYQDGIWCFKLNGEVDSFFEFKSTGINKYFLYLLIFFIKKNIKKQLKDEKNENLINVWNKFLKNNNKNKN